MKEFATKHPILTFLLVDSAIGGILKTVRYIVDAFTYKPDPNTKEEEPEDEPAGDIQQDT